MECKSACRVMSSLGIVQFWELWFRVAACPKCKPNNLVLERLTERVLNCFFQSGLLLLGSVRASEGEWQKPHHAYSANLGISVGRRTVSLATGTKVPRGALCLPGLGFCFLLSTTPPCAEQMQGTSAAEQMQIR